MEIAKMNSLLSLGQQAVRGLRSNSSQRKQPIERKASKEADAQKEQQRKKNVVSGYLYKTAQVTHMLTRSKFIRRFYELDTMTGLLRIYDTNNQTAKLKNELYLRGKISEVEDSLERQFRPGHEAELKEDVQMPRLYDWPFAVIYGPTDMMLLLASDRADLEMWTKAFKKLMPWKEMDCAKNYASASYI